MDKSIKEIIQTMGEMLREEKFLSSRKWLLENYNFRKTSDYIEKASYTEDGFLLNDYLLLAFRMTLEFSGRGLSPSNHPFYSFKFLERLYPNNDRYAEHLKVNVPHGSTYDRSIYTVIRELSSDWDVSEISLQIEPNGKSAIFSYVWRGETIKTNIEGWMNKFAKPDAQITDEDRNYFHDFVSCGRKLLEVSAFIKKHIDNVLSSCFHNNKIVFEKEIFDIFSEINKTYTRNDSLDLYGSFEYAYFLERMMRKNKKIEEFFGEKLKNQVVDVSILFENETSIKFEGVSVATIISRILCRNWCCFFDAKRVEISIFGENLTIEIERENGITLFGKMSFEIYEYGPTKKFIFEKP